MTTRRLRLPTLLLLRLLVVVGAARSVSAQSTGRIDGVAFDSLAGRPFAGALVSVRGTPRSTFTDSLGRFRIDSLPWGRYRLDLSAPLLEASGLPEVSGEVTVGATPVPTTLALPSFATLATRICGGAMPTPGVQSIVVGVVRDVRDARPLSGVSVEIVASDVVDNVVDKAVATRTRADTPLVVQQRTWTGRAETDEGGGYALCGVPDGIPVSLTATRDALGMGLVVTTVGARSLSRQDLWLAPLDDSTLVGSVRGTVVDDDSQQPVADVQVTISGAAPVRTDGRGQYTIARSPVGTREIEFKRVGVDPVRRSVGVRPMATHIVNASIKRLTTLSTVGVSALPLSPRQQRILDMERRRELKMGYFADSTALLRYPGFSAAIRAVAGDVRPCEIFLDGVRQPPGSTVLQDYQPHMIAQLEVQTRFTPIEYQPRRRCPVLLLWTKLGLP